MYRHRTVGRHIFDDAGDSCLLQLRAEAPDLPVDHLVDLLGECHRHGTVAAQQQTHFFLDGTAHAFPPMILVSGAI